MVNTTQHGGSAGLQDGDNFDGQGTSDFSNVNSVSTSELNNNQIYDSTGRYLGELTGTADATTINDAITDRRASANIIIPDPGFRLGGDTTITIPAQEQNFSLLTIGTPTIEFGSNVSGAPLIEKPDASPSSGEDVAAYIIDSLELRADSGTSSHAMQLRSIKRSHIRNPIVRDAGPINLDSEGKSSTLNWITNARIKGEHTGIEFTNESGGGAKKTNANFVHSPYFSDRATNTQTAYIDRGTDNTWFGPGAEHADIVLRNAEGIGTRVIGGHTERNERLGVLEDPGANGEYSFHRGQTAQKARLTGGGRMESVEPSERGRDFAHLVRNSVPAQTPAELGFNVTENNGTAANKSVTGKVYLQLTTSGSSGDVVSLATGTLGTNYRAYRWSDTFDVVDNSNVVTRVGFYNATGDRAEIVHDPDNDLGNHSGGDIYFELATGGTVRGRQDMGTISTYTDYDACIQRESSTGGTQTWSAYFDGSYYTISNGGTGIADPEWRAKIRATAADTKTVRYKGPTYMEIV